MSNRAAMCEERQWLADTFCDPAIVKQGPVVDAKECAVGANVGMCRKSATLLDTRPGSVHPPKAGGQRSVLRTFSRSNLPARPNVPESMECDPPLKTKRFVEKAHYDEMDRDPHAAVYAPKGRGRLHSYHSCNPEISVRDVAAPQLETAGDIETHVLNNGHVLSSEHSPVGSRRHAYPMMYVDPSGLITVLLRKNVMVEMTLDKTLRLLVPGKCAVTANLRGNVSSLMHPLARVCHENAHVSAQFGEDKMAVVGSQGVLFKMKSNPLAYLVSSSRQPQGTIPIDGASVQFPSLHSDFTMNLFFAHAQQCGITEISTCNDIVRNAKYIVDECSIYVVINGVTIKQHRSGDVDIHSPPRHFHLSPVSNALSLRSHYIDMGVVDDERAYIKRGVKRIHVSHSGIVVSDGQCTTSMDFAGRIVSSS